MKKLKFYPVTLSVLIALSGCEQGEGFGALEEAKAFLDSDGPLITKFDDTFQLGVGDQLKLNFNNEQLGNDFEMSYSCQFDQLIDDKPGSLQDCASLPEATEA